MQSKAKIFNGGKLRFQFKSGNPNDLIEYLTLTGGSYYVRETNTSVSIVCRGVEYFYSMDYKFSKGLFLIRMVKKDFEQAAKSLKIDCGLPYRQNLDNLAFGSRKTRKIDINHAYWQIALNKGYITEATYKKGLELRKKDEFFKIMYCMALSTQGIEKEYVGYTKGVENKSKMIVDPINTYRDMYFDIRNTTYMHMDKLAHLLGNGFKSYNVDEIEFADTVKNLKIVTKYLDNNNLTYKNK